MRKGQHQSVVGQVFRTQVKVDEDGADINLLLVRYVGFRIG